MEKQKRKKSCLSRCLRIGKAVSIAGLVGFAIAIAFGIMYGCCACAVGLV